MTFLCCALLLLSAGATVETQILPKGLIIDLDADRGVGVEDGDRVVKWTNQVPAFAAKDFVKQDKGRQEPGSGRPTLKKSVSAIGGHNTLVFKRQELVNHAEDALDHLLHLFFIGPTASRQGALHLRRLHLEHRNIPLLSRKVDDTTDLSELNGRLGVLLQDEDIL